MSYSQEMASQNKECYELAKTLLIAVGWFPGVEEATSRTIRRTTQVIKRSLNMSDKRIKRQIVKVMRDNAGATGSRVRVSSQCKCVSLDGTG